MLILISLLMACLAPPSPSGATQRECKSIWSWVFVVWVYVVTRFQMQTNDQLFNNLTTFKTVWQEPPDPLRSSHPKPVTSARDCLQKLQDYQIWQVPANMMQMQCKSLAKWNWEILHLRLDLQSQWKWQERLPWIPLKSLTNEDKAELGQIMLKEKTTKWWFYQIKASEEKDVFRSSQKNWNLFKLFGRTWS